MKRPYFKSLFIYSILLIITSCGHKSLGFRTISSEQEVSRSIEAAHDFYRKAWIESHKKDLLIELLEGVVRDGGSANEASYLKLKELRKHANLYRISFTIFSKKGNPPPDYNLYVKRFGKINDALDANQKDAALKESKWLLAWVKKNKAKEIGSDFKPISVGKFKKKMKKTLSKLKANYSVNQISQHELHKFRKKLKFFLQLYFYDELITGKALRNGKALDLFIDEIGFVHDDYIAKVLNGSLTESDEIVPISAAERDQFFFLLKNIEKDIFGDSCLSIINRLLI